MSDHDCADAHMYGLIAGWVLFVTVLLTLQWVKVGIERSVSALEQRIETLEVE